MSTDVMTNPKTTTKEKKRISTKVIAQIGVLGAIAMVLMLFDIPLPFAPTFYHGTCSRRFDRTGQNPVEPPDQRYINSRCWRPRELPDRMCNVHSGFPDLSEVTFSQGCDHRYGNGNCFYDNCRMFYQCIPSASSIRCCIPYAD